MSHAMTRAERLQELERLYLVRGYTDIEMADRLGVDRTTIYRDRIELEGRIPIYQDGEGRYRIDRSVYVSNLRLNLAEALSLYLAARRASQQTRLSHQHVASAIEKLSVTLHQPMTERLVRAADTILSQRQDATRSVIFTTVATAWAESRRLKLEYRALRAQHQRTHRFDPYLLEPSPWSDGVYLIGRSDLAQRVITLKLDRIIKAELLGPFEPPADFDEESLLRHAWGIWGGENAPETVVLRFAPGQATRRIKESVWHPLEDVTDLEDGGCRWEAPIADWQEMLPWILGWGSQVEVLGPERLRTEITREAQRLGEMYAVVSLLDTAEQYYAHSREGMKEAEWQLLKKHLTATGALAFDLGRDARISHLAKIAGLLHDIGKYSRAFQDRLRGSKRQVDHATAGAREVMALFPAPPHKDLAELISYCIAGHHSGLPDYGSMGDMETDGTLLARREKKKLEDYNAYKAEIKIDPLQIKSPRIRPSRFRFGERERSYPGFSVSFLTRMVFSTLVDADWLDTEEFMLGETKPRGQYASIEALALEFEQYMQRFASPQNVIDRKRTETLHACLAKADQEPGFFTLTVPTGGGKTLASMAFALKHAVKRGLSRIIYVIPFTSIIEQNAAVFREALGPLGQENVLEHHSNLDWEQLRENPDHEGDSVNEKLKLAAENWDIPIVVTTNVQFFESLFASKKSRARKLHNIAKSIVIFDEVQMLPRDFLKPSLLAMSELVQNYGVSVVLSTATQPALQDFFPAGTVFTELAPDPPALFDFYRRVQVKSLGKLTDEALLERLNADQQVLCIVNTRRHAKGLFDDLNGEGNFHLSTLMCPAHRKETLVEIRKRLEHSQPCRVVSTQVMEAGIDVDFPVGYRAMAGLDSIIQAAGRVNREGKHPKGDMFIFHPQTKFIRRTPIFIEQTAAVAQATLRNFVDDSTTISAIQCYYKQLYLLQDETAFDSRQILNYFDKGTGRLDFDFKTAAENFKLIDDNTVAVIVPYNSEATRLLETLQHTLYPSATLRKLQQFTVNIYEREFLVLQSQGAIQTLHERYHALDDQWMQTYYHSQTGLVLPESSGGEAVFFD